MDYPKSVPNVGLVNGKFVDENTTLGVVGSLIPSAWGNAVTDEVLNVIRAAGLDPAEADHNQLLTAIKKLAEIAPLAFASQEDAETGTDTAKVMSALRVFQAIAKAVPQASETVRGIAKSATSAQVAAGVDDATFVTPKKHRAAGLQLSGIRTEDLSGANVALASADAGSLVVFGGTGGGSLTLPKASTVRAGASITIHAASAIAGTNTLKVVSGDTLSGMLQFMAPAGVMRSGDSVVCTSDGTSNWVISVDCSYNFVAQAVAQLFASRQSLVQAAGYEQGPGGKIHQWGTFTYTAAGAQSVAIPLPIQFPNGILSGTVSAPSRLTNTAIGVDIPVSTRSTLSFASLTASGSGPSTVFYNAWGF